MKILKLIFGKKELGTALKIICVGLTIILITAMFAMVNDYYHFVSEQINSIIVDVVYVIVGGYSLFTIIRNKVPGN